MPSTIFMGIGHYVPEKVVTNHDLAKIITTSDEWIQQRSGIVERRYVDFETEPMGTSDLAARAAARALEDAGVSKDEVELIILATLSPDKTFPGDGVHVQAKLGVPSGVPALDIRNQCTGFLYGLAVADAFIRLGTYRRVLLIGAEVHSTGLDFSDEGRDVTVLFGDGAAAVVLGPTEDAERGVLSVHLHADGRYSDALHIPYPSSREMPRVTKERLAARDHWPHMNGKTVFKHAVTRLPETIKEALDQNGLEVADIDLVVPHQANLRINEMVAERMGIPQDRVFNNIQKYGNTTAASIPLALSEARQAGRIREGQLVCVAGFGSGFTWGSALIRW